MRAPIYYIPDYEGARKYLRRTLKRKPRKKEVEEYAEGEAVRKNRLERITRELESITRPRGCGDRFVGE